MTTTYKLSDMQILREFDIPANDKIGTLVLDILEEQPA